MSEHTYPFVATTWILLLAAQGFSGLSGHAPSQAVIALDPAASDPLSIVAFLDGVFHSISQVFFKEDSVSALLLLADLAVNSLAAAAFGLCGAVLAVIAAHLFGVESELITSGLQGFSPVLTAIAFGTVFQRPGLGVAAYAALVSTAQLSCALRWRRNRLVRRSSALYGSHGMHSSLAGA